MPSPTPKPGRTSRPRVPNVTLLTNSTAVQLTEDLPRSENRVTVERDGSIKLTYTVGNKEASSRLYHQLKSNCHAHELDNLYVVDTSFLPSIGAVNPALTAMANTLRVGDHPLERLGV